MSKRSTPEYLSTIRKRPDRDRGTGAKCFSCLNITDDEWFAICDGETPKTLPPAMIVARAEFVRERIYPCHEQVCHDYRVHFKDGTYDLVTICPGMDPPRPGKYWHRGDSLRRGNDFVTWEEDRPDIDARFDRERPYSEALNRLRLGLPSVAVQSPTEDN